MQAQGQAPPQQPAGQLLEEDHRLLKSDSKRARFSSGQDRLWVEAKELMKRGRVEAFAALTNMGADILVLVQQALKDQNIRCEACKVSLFRLYSRVTRALLMV